MKHPKPTTVAVRQATHGDFLSDDEPAPVQKKQKARPAGVEVARPTKAAGGPAAPGAKPSTTTKAGSSKAAQSISAGSDIEDAEATPPRGESMGRTFSTREQNRRLHLLARKTLLPLLQAIEKHLNEALKGEISPARIALAVYGVCDDYGKKRGLSAGKRRTSAFLYFHRLNRLKVVGELTEDLGRKPSQTEVYSSLGARWRELKEHNQHLRYVAMERMQREDVDEGEEDADATPTGADADYESD